MQLYKLSQLPSAIVVVALTAALCRHLRLDRLQLRVMVLLWLPRWRRQRLCLLRRLLSPHWGKADRAVKVISSSSGNLSGKSVRSATTIPWSVTRLVVAENHSCDLLAGAGGADMVLQGLFADLPQVFACGSESLPAPRVHRVLNRMLHRGTGRVVCGLDRRLDDARLGDYREVDFVAVVAAQLGNKRFLARPFPSLNGCT